MSHQDDLQRLPKLKKLHDAAKAAYLNASKAARATRAAYREAGYLDPVETTHAAAMAFFFGIEKYNDELV